VFSRQVSIGYAIGAGAAYFVGLANRPDLQAKVEM
jgi:hypothetical protein